GRWAKAKRGLRSKQPRGACCPSPDDHEGADTEPDLASGFHIETRRRSPTFRRPGDAYNRDRHPSSNVLVFNHSNDKTRRAPESARQVTAIACSIVGRPPRIPDANRDRQCALG